MKVDEYAKYTAFRGEYQSANCRFTRPRQQRYPALTTGESSRSSEADMNEYVSQPAMIEEVHFREELYPRGFRKVLGMLIIIFATSIPPISNWQYGDDGAAGG